LATDGSYKVYVLTRNVNTPQALDLAVLPHVTIVPFGGYNDADIRRVLAGADSTYVNTNGFAIGEKAESTGNSGSMNYLEKQV